ncbi:MAG TPA: succinate dehydrogenase, hydrophobic membrane anchor protein [Allosphingosinicella sp.]|jgi:succinate dehydrogenase / fumarate reductase membrane anchor subunit
MTMETPLSQVRGLGASGEGAKHWGLERATAASSLILLVWLGVSLLRLPDLSYLTVTSWMRSTLVAVPMLLLIFSVFWHLKSGLQVIVEDYVHEEGSKLLWIMVINFLSVFGAAIALFAVLRIAFAGTPA